VCDVDGKYIIACATLDVGRKKAAVGVWTYEYSARKTATSSPRSFLVPLSFIFISLILLVILGTLVPAPRSVSTLKLVSRPPNSR
jgi:hypothetical protein